VSFIVKNVTVGLVFSEQMFLLPICIPYSLVVLSSMLYVVSILRASLNNQLHSISIRVMESISKDVTMFSYTSGHKKVLEEPVWLATSPDIFTSHDSERYALSRGLGGTQGRPGCDGENSFKQWQ
jgi:hypothetical protein